MQEEYLHYLWRLKRLDFNKLHLINFHQEPVNITETGWYNLDAGPDFFNGAIEINGIKWHGNIEHHVKSSDWYLHKHHLDPAYENVILHVVYEYDKPVVVKGRELPTIELKHQIDPSHLSNYHHILQNCSSIPCSSQIKEHFFELSQQIDLSFLNRIERKGLALLEGMKTVHKHKNALFIHAILKAIGGKTNAIPMQELAHLLSYNSLQREKWDKIRLEALVFGAAGFLDETQQDAYYQQLKKQWCILKAKYRLHSMRKASWKFGGIRPVSFPTMLLAQLCAFLFQFDWNEWEKLDAEELLLNVRKTSSINIHPYWKTHYVFGKTVAQKKTSFSPIFISNLIINGIVPAYVALKHLTNNHHYTEKALDLISSLPAEKNNIIKQWEALGYTPKNALETQGLIELKNEFCNFKKCLSCKVGCGILEK